jgi:hypothetical protein
MAGISASVPPDGSDTTDAFQAAWADPAAAHAIYVDERYGILVIPDKKPVVPMGHIMIISREAVPFEELSSLRKHQLLEAGDIMRRRIAYGATRYRRRIYTIFRATTKMMARAFLKTAPKQPKNNYKRRSNALPRQAWMVTG